MNDNEKLASFIKDMKFTMMTTVSEDGSLFSRPMATLELNEKEFNGRLWFFTKFSSPKVEEIREDQHINLAYAETDKQRYVSVSGKASVVRDREMMEKLWKPTFKAWFPEGLEDPDIALIAVDVETAELWDSPPSKVVQLAGFAKAIATGESYDSQGHSKIIDVNQSHQ